VNSRIQKQIERRKRRIARRLDKNDNRGCDRPIMTASNMHYEIADRTRATAHGGIGAVHLLVRRLGLDRAIDSNLGLLKIHLPYHESDHVLFDQSPCFFYITNRWDLPAEEVVFSANDRCNQENLLQQLKSGVRSLSAPVDSLLSNWAYMVMASLAWSLKAWSALVLPQGGRWSQRHQEEKRKLLRMDFTTFRRALIDVPAQIVRTGRKLVYRLLAWNPWQHVFFRLLDQLRQPLRC